MINQSLKLCIGSILLIGVTACQPPADKNDATEVVSNEADTVGNETVTHNQQSIKSQDSTSQDTISQETTSQESTSHTAPNNDNISEKPVTVKTPIASQKSEANKLECDTVRRLIESIDKTSKIEDIHHIDSQLPSCLKEADQTTVVTLLKQYEAMYGRFLTEGIDSETQAYNDAMYELYMEGAVDQAQLKKLPERLRYLIGLVQSDDDIYLKDLGEGYLIFSHNLKKMASQFTPYLPVEEQVFIERMAVDNQESFWSDASVTVSFKELIQRALFWENYIKQYPKSPYTSDAKILYNQYRYLIFFGYENTQWTDDAMHYFHPVENNWAMIDLSKKEGSQLAKDAQKFLTFLAIPDDVRQQKYPVDTIDEDGYERHATTIAMMQLDQVLQIPIPWDDADFRDCLNGVFCYDNVESF